MASSRRRKINKMKEKVYKELTFNKEKGWEPNVCRLNNTRSKSDS